MIVGGSRMGSQQQLEVLSTMHYFLAAMHHHQQQQQALGASPGAGAAAGGDVLTVVLADDTPTTTVRAVLTEMTKALGGAAVMGLLVQLQLPRSAPVFRLVSRLTSLPIPPAEDAATTAAITTNALSPSGRGQGLSDDGERERVRRREEEEAVLRVSLSSLIDEITSARYHPHPLPSPLMFIHIVRFFSAFIFPLNSLLGLLFVNILG